MITVRRQPCRILIKARYWLLRPPNEAQLLSLLAAELPASPVPCQKIATSVTCGFGSPR
jgi:hypothetical protein